MGEEQCCKSYTVLDLGCNSISLHCFFGNRENNINSFSYFFIIIQAIWCHFNSEQCFRPILQRLDAQAHSFFSTDFYFFVRVTLKSKLIISSDSVKAHSSLVVSSYPCLKPIATITYPCLKPIPARASNSKWYIHPCWLQLLSNFRFLVLWYIFLLWRSQLKHFGVSW